MKESTQPVSPLSSQTRAELEMLYAVLDDGIAYPWNPGDAATPAYYEQLDNALAPAEFTSADIESQWSRILQKAEALWEKAGTELEASLVERFESRMPVTLLRQLAAKVQEMADSNLALIDQLVEVSQSILHDWSQDDLQVMARPLALAMRDGQGEAVEVALSTVREADWESLSEIEQARLGLAIARHALNEASAGPSAG